MNSDTMTEQVTVSANGRNHSPETPGMKATGTNTAMIEKVVEAIERLIGARPGQKLEVNFRAASLETTIRRAGRRLAISLTAGAAILASALTAVSSNRVAGWVPVAFGVISAGLLLALLVDLIRKRG